MPRKSKRVIHCAEALKLVRCSRPTVRLFEGFSPESSWRQYVTESTGSRKRKTLLEYENSMKK